MLHLRYHGRIRHHLRHEIQEHRRAQQVRKGAGRRKVCSTDLHKTRAQRDKAIAKAKGEAAKILENGKATADAMAQMIEVWKNAGDHAQDVFLMQKLDSLMTMIVSTIQEIKVNRLVLLQTEGADITKQLIGAAEQLKAALGVDVAKMLTNNETVADKD